MTKAGGAWADNMAPTEAERPRSEPATKRARKVVDGDNEARRRHNYVEAALLSETEAVRTASEGTRNDQLNKSAFNLGQFVGGGHLNENDAVSELTDAARVAGLSKDETQKTLASGMKAGKAEPRQIPEPATIGTTTNGCAEPPPGRFDDDEPGDGEPEVHAEPQPEPRQRRPLSVLDVLGQWQADGPLVHEPTGIKQLDEWTGGGFVYGSRVYLPGAPDAGKTLFLLQLAHVWLQRGVVVGLLAVDEEPTDIVTRLTQRVGYARHHCEARDPRVLAKMQTEIGQLPLRLYDDTWTIEAAASDLTKHASGKRAALLIDSVQTVTCDRESAAALTGHEMSEVSAVTARVRAIRYVATTHRLLTVATSEMGRSAYSSGDPAQQTKTLAAGKWSGAIEYSARIMLGVRSVPGETDLVELEVAKNKHGPRDVKIHLRIDRQAQSLSEVVFEPEPAEATNGRKTARTKAETVEDAKALVAVLEKSPGLKARELRAAMRAATGIGHDRVDAAVALLGPAVVREAGPNRAQHMKVDLSLLIPEVRMALEVSK